MRRVTGWDIMVMDMGEISIHTLHAEGDGKYDEKIAMVF